MLDSDQEPSYNLSKNLLLLPRILKLMKDMVDDSTPLNNSNFESSYKLEKEEDGQKIARFMIMIK